MENHLANLPQPYCFTQLIKKTRKVKIWAVHMCSACIDRMEKSASEASFDELDALSHVPVDDALDALAHNQRRTFLFALLDHSPQDDFPVKLATFDDEGETLEHLTEMHHVHLPKLADYGFIDWNPQTHEVAKGPKLDEIKPLLELLADNEDELPEGWF